MKKIKMIILLTIFMIGLSSCGTKKYEGYWCNYDETATIVVLLKNDNTEQDRNNLEKTFNGYLNLSSFNYYSREDYMAELGEDGEDIDIYATYVVQFNSMDSIGTYIEDLNKMSGVYEAKQSNAKSNIALYNIKKGHKYEFTNSDEATESDTIKGKYKIKNGVITFTPDDKEHKTTMLYIKNNHLCEDAECNRIFAASDQNCSAK